MLGAGVRDLLELDLLPILEDDRLQRPGSDQQIPGLAGTGLKIGDGCGGTILVEGRMISVEEILAVVAERRSADAQRLETELIGELGSGKPEFFGNDRKLPNLTVSETGRASGRERVGQYV